MTEESKKTKRANPDEWVASYGDLLFQYTLARVNDRVKAEDLVQDTFLSAFKALKGFKGNASEKTWLFSILKNKIIDHYRKESNNLSKSISDFTHENNEWFSDEGAWLDHKQPKEWGITENPSELTELRNIIYTCKQKLNKQLDLVFTLKYLEDLKSDEICKELGISSSNYWVMLHRSRLQMRDCIEKNWNK